jgi:hypothetical protein
VNRWPLARYMFGAHLPFLLVMLPLYLVGVALFITAFAVFGTVEHSLLDVGSQVLRWIVLGYGIHLTYGLLPVFLVHGQTRREFLAQVPLFLVVSSVILAALICLAYLAETALYRATGWTQQVSGDRLYGSASEYGLVFLSYLAMFVVWSFVGAFIGAAFYRSDGLGLLTLPVALVLVAVAGFGIGFNQLPWVDISFGVDHVSVPATAALCGGSAAVGLALMWATVHDIPLRNRTA